MATEDERRLTFSFETCLDFFTTAPGKKSLITKIKMARAEKDSFKENRRIVICRFRVAVLYWQKRKGWKFLKSAGFLTNGVAGLEMKFTFKALHILSGN